MNKAPVSRRAAGSNAHFLFGTIHAELPDSSPAAVVLESVRKAIAEEDLAGRGLDIGPSHVTFRYGILGEDVSAVEAVLRTYGPISCALGPTSCFPPSADSAGVAVIFAKINCPALHALHQRLGEIVDFIEPTYTYEPHITLAYVRPEAAEKYVGNQITAGHTFLITEVVVRTISKNETIVRLNGQAEATDGANLDPTRSIECLGVGEP
jgi:2'-5' RNA ligase